MRISDWSSDVCSSDLVVAARVGAGADRGRTQAPAPAADRRYRDRHRHQRRPALWQGDGEDAVDAIEDEVRIGGRQVRRPGFAGRRSEEHTSELQSLMRISYAVFCLKNKKNNTTKYTTFGKY